MEGETGWQKLAEITGEDILLEIACAILERHDVHQAALLVSEWAGLKPDSVQAHIARSRVMLQVGDLDSSLESAARAIGLNNIEARAYAALGDALLRLKRLDEAVAAYARCLTLQPDSNAAALNLSSCLISTRKLTEAQAVLLHLEQTIPDDPDLWSNIAAVKQLTGYPAEGWAAAQRALALQPGHAEAATNGAACLNALGRPAAAQKLLRQKTSNEPTETSAIRIAALVGLGMAEEAVSLSRTISEDREAVRRSIQTAMLHDATTKSGDIIALERSDRVPSSIKRARQGASTNLKIGLYSADFRAHAMGYFLPGMIEGLRAAEAEVFCYSGVPREDQVTGECENQAHHWRRIHSQSDAVAAATLEADRLDLLIDCSGATDGARPGLLERRPAPLQVSWILGSGAPTGASAIDYLVADSHLLPERPEGWPGAPVAYLPWSIGPFRPNPDWPPPAAPRDRPVYGCFAGPARVSPQSLDAWHRLIADNQEARLLLWHPAYADAENVEHWKARLDRFGLRGRYELAHPGVIDMAQAYASVCAILDTYPVSGATTTLIALWMGIPVITLAGTEPWQRFGLEILTACGQQQWIAEDLDGFRTAIARATERRVLSGHALRRELASSPLMDVKARGGDMAHLCSNLTGAHGALR